MRHHYNALVVIPCALYEKLRYIEDMVALMMIDGDLDDNEMAMCKIYAIMLGYESDIVERMILDIADKLKDL